MRNPNEGRSWLSLLENSHLSQQSRSLVENMQTAVQQNDLAHVWPTLYLMLENRGTIQDLLEQAELTVECALIVYQLGDLHKTVKLLKEAHGLYGENKHYQAVVLWMIGCVQWRIPEERSQAFSSWNQCLNLFSTLKSCSVDPDHASWYEEHIQQIRQDFSAELSWQAPASQPPEPVNDQPVSSDNERNDSPSGTSEEVNPLLFQLFQVVEKIPAGGFGPVGFRSLFIGEVDIDRVIIRGRYYRMINLRGTSKRVTLPANKYVVVKITGDSMNKPGKLGEEGIDLDDYVLLRLQEAADDGDIIAAEIDNEDNAATLKRLRIPEPGFKYILEPQSTNPAYQPREFTSLNEGFHIRGVALVAFKPIHTEN